MTDIIKHMGFTNTGSKIAVIISSLPGKKDYCLVVETDALPPKFSDAFQTLLQFEAQRSSDTLSELLSRRKFSTGTADTMLMELHNTGNLQRIPISNVTMNVTKSQTMPLQEIVDAMANEANEVTEPSDIGNAETAKNFLMQSLMLYKDADELQEKAYALDPTLKPKKKGRKPGKAATSRIKP